MDWDRTVRYNGELVTLKHATEHIADRSRDGHGRIAWAVVIAAVRQFTGEDVTFRLLQSTVCRRPRRDAQPRVRKPVDPVPFVPACAAEARLFHAQNCSKCALEDSCDKAGACRGAVDSGSGRNAEQPALWEVCVGTSSLRTGMQPPRLSRRTHVRILTETSDGWRD